MKNYNIDKNHFLYIIYISRFLPPPSQYKHGKNEVTVNVQVPKQNICLTQNTCPWLLAVGTGGQARPPRGQGE